MHPDAITSGPDPGRRRAGRPAGAEYVDVITASIGHDICKPAGIRWVEGLFPGDVAAPVHPNALGMQGAAQQVTNAINGGTR